MSDPNIQTIDLASVRETCPNPTCDVKFLIVNQNTGEETEVLAHKLILSFGSPVFMRQFYGTMKEEKDSIPVKDSSVEAFRILLDIIYNKKVSLTGLDFKLLAELFYLAEKYHLDLWKDSIVKEVSSRKMVSGHVLEAAKVAENNVHLDKFSDTLYELCSVFVKDNPGSIFEISDIEEVGEDTSFTLHRLLARANRTNPTPPPPSPNCDNCKHDPCLHGQGLSKNNFVVGAKINIKKLDNYNYTRRTVKLVGSRVDYVRVEDNYPNSFDVTATDLTYKCK